ncbi:MAG TPA: ABC transporter ATP-binding protein [Thermodesulfobacteriota bacterium]|nr:ABC transporter ATP-binding protein [Thermodesulfobacteriota bacterium]
MFDVKQISAGYGDIQILHTVSLKIERGEMVSVLGANGAGKTTLLLTLSGVLRPTAGEIYFFNKRVDCLEPHQIVKQGVVRIPEGRKIFQEMTVLENLELGSYIRTAKIHRKENLVKVFAIFPRLEERKHQLAGTLSGGEQQMLAIGRGLMTLPRILMLDEPSLGLAPLIVTNLFEVIKRINQEGMTILLVEQNMHLALSTAQRGYVIENGRIILEGESEKLLGEDHVRKAYLGI